MLNINILKYNIANKFIIIITNQILPSLDGFLIVYDLLIFFIISSTG